MSTDNQNTSYTTAAEQVDVYLLNTLSESSAYDQQLASVFVDYTIEVIKANNARVETKDSSSTSCDYERRNLSLRESLS